MLPALIVLSLISLLVATEPDTAGTDAPPPSDPPLRPRRRTSGDDQEGKRERIAA